MALGVAVGAAGTPGSDVAHRLQCPDDRLDVLLGHQDVNMAQGAQGEVVVHEGDERPALEQHHGNAVRLESLGHRP